MMGICGGERGALHSLQGGIKRLVARVSYVSQYGGFQGPHRVLLPALDLFF
ncbi:hypothetical protein HOLleu_44926 [Holothuria leucospilota]|uniref:Uncharacterized protein n=1 Tax=Holothuria leucospilota TaxID=206669 RepID=A0A9Q1B964_HOLLE|nr:hypothetical protein HOLleu_44926 [Holothuria leucospilota]